MNNADNVVTNEQKDYSLLRPFDLAAAKRGELLCNFDGFTTYEFLGQGKSNGIDQISIRSVAPVDGHLYTCEPRVLWMQPLCWVERKPVYNGDVLYKVTETWTAECVVSDFNGMFIRVDDKEGVHSGTEFKDNSRGYLTWTPPKTKKTYFVNIYFDNGEVLAYKHDTRDLADKADICGIRTACVPIDVEELQ